MPCANYRFHRKTHFEVACGIKLDNSNHAVSDGQGEHQVVTACSMAAPSTLSVELAPTDLLYVPHRKRMTKAYVTNEETGGQELVLYYGNKEVSFDEVHLFPFGEALTAQPDGFMAQDATAWGPGYPWDELRPLLETLVEEGVLKRGIDNEVFDTGLVPSKLPPSTCPMHRTWSAPEIESITTDLGGRPVEIGYIETIFSVYRIPHPALDADERQVGEANVWPPALRLDRDTEWRVCQYPGSRYRDPLPMNVTALKAMIKHWKPLLATLLKVRAEMQRRLPRMRDGWTVGDMHTLSAVVLCVPAYQLMKRGGTSPQRPLHPVLSSLFRITDGIRMTTHEMLFLSNERTRFPHEPTSAEELHAFAERNGLFISGHGVCAGPRAMIDEFLTTVFSGKPEDWAAGLAVAPEVEELMTELPAIVDYALLGFQTWCVTRSVWLAMSRADKALRAVFAATPADLSADEAARFDRMRARLDDDWRTLDQQRIADDYERDVHLQVYVDGYEQSWRALRHPVGPATLAACIDPLPVEPAHDTAARQLRDLLSARFSGRTLDSIVEILVMYLREEQSMLRSTLRLQAAINTLLERPQPTRPLTARELQLHFVMYGGSISRFAYLFDTIEAELGIHVECTADHIGIHQVDSAHTADPPANRYAV